MLVDQIPALVSVLFIYGLIFITNLHDFPELIPHGAASVTRSPRGIQFRSVK